MAEFDPERFEDKYAHYFTELQRAYKDAFQTMKAEYDSTLIHAIDQQILAESEPFYEDGRFRVELPADPAARLTAVEVADDRLADVLDRYRTELESELYAVFDLSEPEE